MMASRSGHGNRLQRALRMLRKQKSGTFGMALAILIVMSAIFAPVLSPYPPNQQFLMNPYDPPSAEHWFGTDSLGRDLFSRVLWGGRTSLLLGLTSVVLAMVAGGAIGIVTGFLRGTFDRVTTVFIDILLAFPVILLAIFLVGVFGTSTFNTALAIGVSSMPLFVRVVRGEVIKLREEMFVEAARALGSSVTQIMWRHILRNVVGSLVILGTLRIGTAILAESGLSFLGLGVQIPDSSWGSLVADGKNLLTRAPWISLIPGFVIMIAVLAYNLVGDSLRDILDPRLR